MQPVHGPGGLHAKADLQSLSCICQAAWDGLPRGSSKLGLVQAPRCLKAHVSQPQQQGALISCMQTYIRHPGMKEADSQPEQQLA